MYMKFSLLWEREKEHLSYGIYFYHIYVQYLPFKINLNCIVCSVVRIVQTFVRICHSMSNVNKNNDLRVHVSYDIKRRRDDTLNDSSTPKLVTVVIRRLI